MLRLILALVGTLIAVLLVAPRVIPLLHRLKFGQTIYDLGPESHKAKQGTPTMGGLVFALAATAVALVLGRFHSLWDMGLAVIVFAALSMAIGFADDFIKVVRKRSLGLVWWQKVLGQVAIGLLFSLYCYHTPAIGSRIVVPFVAVQWDLGPAYVPLMTLFIMFMINSANLQDGLDGLLSGVAASGGVAWSVLSLLAALALLPGIDTQATGSYLNVALFNLALVGGCLGFLWLNFYPAKVFMGDTGSMWIGGAAVATAMVLRLPLLMLLINFTMILSSGSVILQRVYFKVTKGKRIIKMSPIHHHFELSGMSEPQIVAMYTAVTTVLSLVAALSIL